MKPTAEDVHINAALSNISVSYSNDSYIADQIFPIVTVAKESDIYAKYNKRDWLADEAEIRIDGSEAAEGGYAVDVSNTYTAIPYAIKKKVTDRQRANADPVFQLDIEAAEYVADKLALRMEVQVAAGIDTTGVWGTDLTLSGTDQWSDFANSDPIGNIRTAMSDVRKAIGRNANTVVMGDDVWIKLQDHPDILERSKYTSGASITTEMVARMAGVDRILIGSAVKDTAAESQTSSTSYVWGKNVLVAFVAPRPALRTPSAGYIFRHGTRAVKRYREDRINSDWVEGQESWAVELTASDAGSFIAAAVA